MSARLLACPACSRHIRLTEERCPFCGAPCAASFASSPLPVPPPRGHTRAGLFRFGALAVAGVGGSAALATMVGCSNTTVPYGVPPDCNVCDSGMDSKADATLDASSDALETNDADDTGRSDAPIDAPPDDVSAPSDASDGG